MYLFSWLQGAWIRDSMEWFRLDTQLHQRAKRLYFKQLLLGCVYVIVDTVLHKDYSSLQGA